MKGTGFSPYIKEERTVGFRFSVGKQARKAKTFLSRRVRGKLAGRSGDLLGREGGIELCAIEEGIVFEHAEDSVEQLTHNGDKGNHFALSESLQVEIEGL